MTFVLVKHFIMRGITVILKALSNSNMTPMGRVAIVKTFIISQLVFLLSNLPSKDFIIIKSYYYYYYYY